MTESVDNRIRARVFISCGQQKDSDEVRIAQDIEAKLHSLGFDPYVAVEEHTLKGVKENLFQRLSESEYIIFVDFQRERLYKGENGVFVDTQQHRGSLFSNQELAIATFLEIECLTFQENGIKKEDGILRFIQSNCIPFSDRHLLPDVVANKVREKIDKREWNAGCKNELILKRENSKQYVHVDYVGKSYYRPVSPEDATPARFYHMEVENLHWKKTARNCSVFLEKIENVSTKGTLNPDLIEYKWQGITTPTVSIPPKRSRHADAFHIFYTMPKTIFLGLNPFILDYSGYLQEHTISIATEHNLTFVVFSDNFPVVRRTFRLHMGDKLDDVEFSELQDLV